MHQPMCSVQSGNGIINALKSHYDFKIFTKHELETVFFKDVDMVAFPGGFGNSDSYDYLLKINGDPIREFVNRGGKWQNINATLVVPGDMVLLACGSAIPADCRINAGTIDVDQAALTGESLPVTMYKGDSCKMVRHVPLFSFARQSCPSHLSPMLCAGLDRGPRRDGGHGGIHGRQHLLRQDGVAPRRLDGNLQPAEDLDPDHDCAGRAVTGAVHHGVHLPAEEQRGRH